MSDLAQQIADRLLTNGFGDKGDRLAIKLGDGPFPKEKDLGGWGRNSIIDQIQPLIDVETTRLREALAWAAECQAATLETLPKSASKRDRERHVTLCKKLAGLLIGAPVERRGFQPFDIEKTVEEAYQRCERAASADQQNINPTGEENE